MYLKKLKNKVSLFLEAEDMCRTCRYSGLSTRLNPCAFIAAAREGKVPSVPFEEGEDYFFVTNCGAYSILLNSVKDVSNEDRNTK